MQEFVSRMERLRSWNADISYGIIVAQSETHLAEASLASVAFVESLYPEGMAGQEVLESNVNPEAVDEYAALPALLTILNGHIEDLRSGGGYQRHLSHRRNPAEFEAHEIESTSWGNKPRGAICTSTANDCFPGMWFAHLAARDTLDSVEAWRVGTNAGPELLITSAVEWCDFSIQFAAEDGKICWQNVAQSYSRVSLTALAVARIDCFEFSYRGAVVSPGFWGVETTVWLRAGITLKHEQTTL
ncbi:hypothetical protein [Rathayibacter sp. AY1C5]|uniref:hypothetical protein n=1 Tax=Rathayibacter sp. AY1C5 TaxID=2080538 RepID=UPI0011AFE246|nr:hypothetical protein [Rathayibacter sp. AY1C5]